MYNSNFFVSVFKLGIAPWMMPKIKKELRKEVENHYKNVPIQKDMANVIKKLSKKYKLVLISGNFNHIVKSFLRKHGIANCFKLVIGGDKIRSKLKKFKMCKKMLKAKNDEILYITDTVGDLKDGKRMKLLTMATSWGYHSKTELKKLRPNYIVNKPKEILEIL